MTICSLQEVAKIISGQSPNSKYYNTEGNGIPFFQGKADFGSLYPKVRVYCTNPIKVAEKDDILLSVRAPVGPTNLSPGKVCIGRGLTAIRPTEQIKLKYLLYFFKCFEIQLQGKGMGTTFKAITQDVIKNIKVPVPTLPEQERIVARIEELFSELDKAVETLKTTKQQLAVYRQAVLKEAFEGSFTVHRSCDLKLEWSSKEETKNLPAIPKEWRYIALSKLGDLGRGKSKHRPRNDPKLFEEGKYPFLQTSEVKAAKQYITEFSKMYGEFGLQQSKLWPKGTLCITIAANIAETAFLGIDACFPDSVVGFTPNENIIPKYIKHFIESQKLRLWAFAPATAQKNINLNTLENLIVPYCSVEEQKDVVAEIETRMSTCDSIEKTVDTSLQQVEAMRHSILKQAFEGEV